jgi:Tol biopolymer transport system component
MRGSRAAARIAIASVTAGALVLAGALSADAALSVTLVSRNSQGTPANGNSTTSGNGGQLSADGHLVAFTSKAANLPHGNGSTERSYVRNLNTGKTILVSVKSDGHPATGDTFSPVLSAGGRFVAFFGPGNRLPQANPPYSQVWLRDLKTGSTRLVSRAPQSNAPGNRDSTNPSLSADGRFVAFNSESTNFDGGDGTDTLVYVRDTKNGRTEIASLNNGLPAYGLAFGESISADGRRVVFNSNDPDLPGADGYFHVYLRKPYQDRTVLIDRDSNGIKANGLTGNPSITPNGRFVVFESYADNFPGGDGLHEQIYLRDLVRGTTRLASRNNAGQRQNGTAQYGRVSADGRYVAFQAEATNLPGGHPNRYEIYGRDMREHVTRLLSRAANGQSANASSLYPSISHDGRFASFYTGATNLGGNTSFTNVFRAGPIG